MDLITFLALGAIIVGGFGLFAWMLQRLETRLDRRIDQLAERIRQLEQTLPREMQQLRRDLTEELRITR